MAYVKQFENFKESNKELVDFFENNGFIVNLYTIENQECAEIEMWTDGGVDMIISLQPFTKKEFINSVESFDIDEEIELHRMDERYKKAFTIRESLSDFENYHNKLKKIAEKIKE
jgi:hypothetical protein